MRKSWIVAAIALLIVGVGVGWYVESPEWTLKQMAAAAQERDAGRLSAYIDYPKLRETTKAQVKAAATAKITSGTSNGFEALGMMIGMSMIDSMVDGMFTPEGIGAMFETEKVNAPSATPAKKPFGLEASNREIIRDGFDRFRLHDKSQPGQDGDLIFERHGLTWKLAQIRIPANLFDENSNDAQ